MAQYKLVKLTSGRDVRLLSISKMYFSKGEPALMLKYQTDLPISDVAALAREADEVWEVFRSDVERAKLSNAIISATSGTSDGFTSTSQSYNFVFQRSQVTWQRVTKK